MPDSKPTFGAWSASALGKTAQRHTGAGVYEDLPDPLKFKCGVARLVQRRTEKADHDPTKPCVFLLHPGRPSVSADILLTTTPMLDQAEEVITGRIWFVSPVVVVGRYIELGICSNEQMFSFVTDELGLGSTQAIIFDPRPSTPELRFYPDGLAEPESVEIVELHRDGVTLEEVYEVIEGVYRNCLCTPEVQVNPRGLWKDKSKGYPSKDAEGQIQGHLKAGLAGAFPAFEIRHESTSRAGRLDLEIEGRSSGTPNHFLRHLILELKVLRSYGSGGSTYSENETLDWIEGGVKQAAGYRDDRGAKASALCCFDMRREDTGEACFEHVRDLATRHRVELWRWFLYPTSQDYREAAVE